MRAASWPTRRWPSPSTAVLRRRRLAGRRVTDARCHIRPAQAADLPALVAIERVAFTDPWSRGDFEDCLGMGVQILVAEGDSGVVGYIVGRAMGDQGEILNLGVPLSARRRGVG